MPDLSIITGGWKSRVNESGGARQIGFGDSIWYTTQTWSLLGQFCVACVAAGITCNGGVGDPYNNPGAGWPVRPVQFATGGFGTLQGLRPGAVVTADGTSGNNLRKIDVVSFTGNYSIFGTPIKYGVSNSVGTAWETGKTLTAAAVGFSTTSPRSPASWRMQTFNRANAQINADNPINLNQAAQLRVYTCTPWAAGSGGSNNVAKVGLAAWNEDETGWQLQVMSVGIFVQNPTSGATWSYCGFGSWTPKNHAYSTGQLITVDPPDYTGRWSDNALIQEIIAYKLDTFLWRCGNNPSEDGIGAYPTEVAAWMARVRACSAAARLVDPTIKAPKFVLFSPYASSSTTSYWDAIRSTNRATALANLSDTEHVDECGYIYDTYGSYATYASTLLRDGTHPKTTALGDANDTLRNAAASFYLSRLNGSAYGVNTVLSLVRYDASLGLDLIGDK